MHISVSAEKNLAKVKAVIFDYGGVLCLPPTAADLEASAQILGITADSFQALWGRNRDRYDRGDLSAKDYWGKFAEDAGKVLTASQIDELSERDVAMWSRLNPTMITWLESLSSSRIKTALLSNMHRDMVHYARQNFKWLERLNYATFSAEVRLIKPDPAIYESCLRGLGVAASDTLFIDDREVNVAAARALEIHGIQFKSIDQLRSELEEAGFPALPSDSALENLRPA